MSFARTLLHGIPLVVFIACSPAHEPTDPRVAALSANLTGELSAAAEPRVTGSGHVLRDLGGGEELTTFSYNAVAHADGRVSGHYQYNFRAAGFFTHGSVTCVSVAGTQGWIGGVIDKIVSPDPEDQTLVGTEIWWRVVDNGEGENSAADQTTSLLFAVPGLPITAASWCRDQNVRGVLRDIVSGNIQVR